MTKKNMPILRFKEFKGNREIKKIQHLIDNKFIISHLDGNHGGLYPRSEEFSSSGIPYITANDFMNGFVDFSHCKYLPNEKAKLFRKGVAKDGDVLFAHNATVGPVALLKTNYEFVILSTTATYFRCNQDKLYNLFLQYSLLTTYFIRQYSRIMSQSTRDQVPITTQRKLYLYLTEIKEQQKIANFIYLIDTKIQFLVSKVHKREEYKKGLMQQIFSQKIRFKDNSGQHFSEWKNVLFGKFLIEKVDKTIETKQYTVLSSTIKGIFLQSEYFNKEIASEDSTGYKILKKNQIVFSPQNLRLGNINYNDKYDIGIVSPSYKIFEINEKFMHSPYFKYIMKSARMLYEYSQASEQGASVVRRNLNMDLFNTIKIILPSVPEQKMITNFLQEIDNKLGNIQKEIHDLEKWKKGLLQKMFI